MTSRVHPLNAARAFEAAARHLNFSFAADELAVTPGAISHQVKKLEDYLGFKLFVRQARGITLTAEGEVIAEELKKGFAQINKTLSDALDRQENSILTLSVAPIFAVKWLLPRMQDFYVNFPDIEVLISTSLDLVDLNAGKFDAAIRLLPRAPVDMVSQKLVEEAVTPMVSPHLVAQKGELSCPGDLSGYVLLHNVSTDRDPDLPNWQKWLSAAGVADVDFEKGQRFSQPDHALQAAIDGGGVVLGWKSMANSDVSAGRLVEPFELQLPLNRDYYFVSSPRSAETRRVRVFQSWLKSRLTD